ncbi:unnamed protein product [Pleuronectes platessa]|uniref:Uncharacterized protein n=1 Tax=Pleuronectes platessa TaxID=8262 RepID=A0A9N7Z1K2_PLEPL|nr:unnamed protein product [Pleuronectes platessa]
MLHHHLRLDLEISQVYVRGFKVDEVTCTECGISSGGMNRRAGLTALWPLRVQLLIPTWPTEMYTPPDYMSELVRDMRQRWRQTRRFFKWNSLWLCSKCECGSVRGVQLLSLVGRGVCGRGISCYIRRLERPTQLTPKYC